jgi:hypothetical protein
LKCHKNYHTSECISHVICPDDAADGTETCRPESLTDF